MADRGSHSPLGLLFFDSPHHLLHLHLTAKENKFDVVLVDTAGRMQDNEPLMRALAKLVSVNNPDKIVFVGEALVGNEAVDQLSKFDRSLKDFSSGSGGGGAGGKGRARGIDGMILTKFDTIVSLSTSHNLVTPR